MAKKDKMFNVSIDPKDVVYTNISTSRDGYNSARMVVKHGDNAYMSVSYEWEGNGIPGFAMDLMGFMKNNNVETSGVWPDQEDAYEEFSAKMKKKDDKKKMDDEEEEDEDKKGKKPWPPKKK